jgi:hypothetical protein
MNSVNSRAVRTLTILAAAAWLVAMPAAVFAQSGGTAPARSVGGLGYGFAGFGGAAGEGESTSTWHVGGGGEAIFGDAVGVGAEIGYLNSFEDSAEGIGVFSANGSYHFNGGAATRRLRPFVTGGYTLGFASDGHQNLFNVGGGVDYWLKPKVGLRIEFRDHIWHEENDTLHFWGVRAGVTFR